MLDIASFFSWDHSGIIWFTNYQSYPIRTKYLYLVRKCKRSETIQLISIISKQFKLNKIMDKYKANKTLSLSNKYPWRSFWTHWLLWIIGYFKDFHRIWLSFFISVETSHSKVHQISILFQPQCSSFFQLHLIQIYDDDYTLPGTVQ